MTDAKASQSGTNGEGESRKAKRDQDMIRAGNTSMERERSKAGTGKDRIDTEPWTWVVHKDPLSCLKGYTRGPRGLKGFIQRLTYIFSSVTTETSCQHFTDTFHTHVYSLGYSS
jgi:hypothetical protein